MSLSAENIQLTVEGKANIVTDNRLLLNRIDLVDDNTDLLNKEKAISFDVGLEKFKMTEEELIFEIDINESFPIIVTSVKLYNNVNADLNAVIDFSQPVTYDGAGELKITAIELLL